MLFRLGPLTLPVMAMLLTGLDAKPSRQHFIDSIQALHTWKVGAISRLERMAQALEDQIRDVKQLKVFLSEKRQSMSGMDETVRAKLEVLKTSIEDVEVAIEDRPDQRTSTQAPTTPRFVPGWWDKGPPEQVINIDCYEAGKPEMYQGTASVTVAGEPCQLWSSQSPNVHLIGELPDEFTDGVFPSNFCRQPLNDFEPKPWCYLRDRAHWAYCDVPLCGEGDNGPSPSEDAEIAMDVFLGNESQDAQYDPRVNIPFDVVVMDTQDRWNQTTYEFVANVRGDYLVTVQIDNTDNMYAVFNIMRYTPLYNSYSMLMPEIKDRIVVDMDQGLGFAIVNMNALERLYVVPDESMSLFDQRLKPGLTTRFSVYCLNQEIPMRMAG